MTDTPDQPDKEEFCAGKDDIPDPMVKNDDGSLTYNSTAERIKRWQEAQAAAEASGNSTKAEYNAALLERSRAAKGPNPTQEKARKLYEWWQTGCGGADPSLSEMTQDMRPYDQLNPYEQARWAALAKALGNHPLNDDFRSGVVQQQSQKYSSIPSGLSWAEYDDVLHPKDAGYAKLRQHWWQLWRPRHEKLTKSSR